MKFLDKRHCGMDIVRTVAVLTVLIGHALIFFPRFFDVQWLLFLAIFGVELFFSLSGFLIGNILIKLAHDRIDFKQVLSFWIKRWLRTIPVYLLVAIVTMLVLHKFYWSYLVFLQNYFPEDLNDFKISWSLTVEEWFYLTFPLLMYVLSKISKALRLNKNILLLLTIMIFILVPLLMRFLAIPDQGNWDMDIRKQIHLRMDAIAYGVLLAFIYHHHKNWFIKNTATVLLGILLICGFVGLWWASNTFINIFTAQSSVFNNVVFYPLINIFSTLCVAYFIRFQTYPHSWLSKVILFISLISYSLYLVHFPIYEWFTQYVQTATDAFVYLSLALLCLFVCGALMYKLVEQPFMRLRDKWVTSRSYSAV